MPMEQWYPTASAVGPGSHARALISGARGRRCLLLAGGKSPSGPRSHQVGQCGDLGARAGHTSGMTARLARSRLILTCRQIFSGASSARPVVRADRLAIFSRSYNHGTQSKCSAMDLVPLFAWMGPMKCQVKGKLFQLGLFVQRLLQISFSPTCCIASGPGVRNGVAGRVLLTAITGLCFVDSSSGTDGRTLNTLMNVAIFSGYRNITDI